MSKGKTIQKVVLICFIIIALDAVSKWAIQEFLPLIKWHAYFYPYGGIGVFKDIAGIDFAIVHEINKGAAWGVFAEYQPYLMLLRIGLILGLIVYIIFVNRQEKMVIPFALIIAGAAGNVIDYFLYGHVVDMFYFRFGSYSYPIFNIADIVIFLGVFWLCMMTLFGKSNSSKRVRSRS